MRKVGAGLGGLALAAGLATTFALSAGAAAPPDGTSVQRATVDELPNPAEEKRRALREVALQKVIAGDAKVRRRGASKVVKVARANGEDQYVELAREKTDKIFVILAEFGDKRHPSYPDRDTNPNIPGPATFNGPLHNAIPAPDRSKDNSTVWQPNYDRAHYQDIYFGRRRVAQDVLRAPVVGPLQRRRPGHRLGQGPVQRGALRPQRRLPVREQRLQQHVGPDPGRDQHLGRRPEGRRAPPTPQIAAELATYDTWDRNDYDDDGNFNERDGYIDHFQIVHSGGDQADGDPHQGEDAIWSHRWKAFQNLIGTGGPAFNKDGGTQIGTTGLWVADYTIQPENGGVSVFAHEYGHDLGLPDHYDTSGGGENGVNWWTIMGQSRVSAPEDQGIGTRPADLGAWDKLQLGWLDYEIVPAGQTRTLDLGPHEYNSAKAQGVVVPLPQKTVVTDLGAPAAGTKQWWSGHR